MRILVSTAAVPVNLLDRIDHHLSDTRTRINPHDFESCATSLLSPLHPGLVPIPGGSDYGLDAEITQDSGLIGLIITSSRSWDGAKRSLRDSLRSMCKNNMPVQYVIAANLTEANRSKREKLKEIAKEFDCELVQVYDRAWFANQFRENPTWRRKILDLEGGPFSFSRQPQRAYADDQHRSTIGREPLIAKINRSPSDVVLFGVPGVGKSHVASKLDGALFLERQPTPERLLGDLIETRAALVVIDDSGARLEDIDLLLRTRDAENLNYRIIATCWPHEKEQVADHLTNSLSFEVDRLTREELGAILRDHGITRLSVIVHLLAQADGRPAWALNLAYLLMNDKDWESVWTGKALRNEIFTFLRMSEISKDAVDVLGTLALLGQINEGQLRRLAGLLEISQPHLMRLIRSVAIAGLADIQEHKYYNRETQQTDHDRIYQIQPPNIAASLASEVYFSARPSPLELREVQKTFPELIANIMQVQIHTKLLGATHPIVPTMGDLTDIPPTSTKGEQILQCFGQLGPNQSKAVIGIYRTRVTTALEARKPATAESEAKILAGRVADAVNNRFPGAVETFAQTLSILNDADCDLTPAITELVEEVRNARIGDKPQISSLLKLISALQAVPRTELIDNAWTTLTCAILAPTFENNYMHPEVLNRIILQSFAWSAKEMKQLYDVARTEITNRTPKLDPTDQLKLIDLLDRWKRIADGRDLPFGGKLNKSQMNVGKFVARNFAKALAPVIKTPGIRFRFNQAAGPLGIELDEPDQLFTALTTIRLCPADYRAMRLHKESELKEALTPFRQQAPTVLMGWLKSHQTELEITGQTTMGAWRIFDHLVRQSVPEPIIWLTAAIEYGLAGSASPLIEACVRADQLTYPITERLLADPNGRTLVTAAVLRHSVNSTLIQTVVDQISSSDIHRLQLTFTLKEAPVSTRHLLFTHPDAEVRGKAAALWAAEWGADTNTMPTDPEWLNAMKSYTVPENDGGDHLDSEALGALAKASPSIFIKLLIRHAQTPTLNGYRNFDEWEGPIQLLTRSERDDLWHEVSKTALAHELFWVIAGNDKEWVTKTVSQSNFSISVRKLLSALQFQFDNRYPFETLAMMMQPLHPEPDILLQTLNTGSFIGDKHERHATNLDILRNLAKSEDEYLAVLGQRGIVIYEPLFRESLDEARRAAVHGTLNY